MEFASNREELNALEAKYVNADTLKDPKCMNLITGGWQGHEPKLMADEVIKRRAQSLQDFYDSEDSIEVRKILSENSLKCWDDPEYAEKALAGFKKWSSDPKLLKIKGERISATINDPEHREAHLTQWREAGANARKVLKEKMASPNYRRSDSKYIMCIETGEVFASSTQAKKVHGGKVHECVYGIRKHTRDKETGQRLSWKEISEEEYLKMKENI